MKVKNPEKTLEFDPDKAADLLSDLIDVYQKHGPTVGEIITVTSNLLYSLGSSIGEFKEKGPSIEELNKLYYSEPGRIDVALMLQGMMMSTWYESWVEAKTKDTLDKGANNEPNAI